MKAKNFEGIRMQSNTKLIFMSVITSLLVLVPLSAYGEPQIGRLVEREDFKDVVEGRLGDRSDRDNSDDIEDAREELRDRFEGRLDRNSPGDDFENGNDFRESLRNRLGDRSSEGNFPNDSGGSEEIRERVLDRFGNR